MMQESAILARPIILYFIGSRYPVSYWGEDRIDIGCQSKTIEEWLNDYHNLAEEESFTESEILEYTQYVTLIKNIHNK